MRTRRYAMVVVVEAQNSAEAYENVSAQLPDAQYGSCPWQVVNEDGNYDIYSLLDQFARRVTEP